MNKEGDVREDGDGVDAPKSNGRKSQEEKAREELMEAVRREGFEAEDFDQAWGRIMGVQAEIALDATMGSKATSAAKFLREVYGEGSEKGEKDDGDLGNAGVEVARKILELIRMEKKRREGGQEMPE